MKSGHLIQQAKSFLLHLKNEERRSINPYVSFADQVIALINNGQVSSRADVIRFTRMSYPRPRMNRQWRTFGNVLEKHLRSNMSAKALLFFFGYLKLLLTIEGKKGIEERNKFQGNFIGRNKGLKGSFRRKKTLRKK